MWLAGYTAAPETGITSGLVRRGRDRASAYSQKSARVKKWDGGFPSCKSNRGEYHEEDLACNDGHGWFRGDIRQCCGHACEGCSRTLQLHLRCGAVWRLVP